MKTKLLFGIITAAAFTLQQGKTQDIHFSQFWMAPLIQNPAYTGAVYDMQGIINYKSQWGCIAEPYKTYDASFDMAFSKTKKKKGWMAAGINFFSDKAGDSQMGTLQGNLNFAYHLRLDAVNTLGAGMMGGFVQRSINYSALQWGNQYDGSSYVSGSPSGEPVGAASRTFIDGGAGIVWTYSQGEEYMTANNRIKINAGASVFHPHQPDYSFYKSGERLYMKWVAHANFLYGIKNTNISIVPSLMYYRQGPTQEILSGILFRAIIKESAKYTGFISGSAFSAGIHYRADDAAVVSVFLEKGLYALGVSYDLNTSDLRTASDYRGGIEISLRYAAPGPFATKSSYKY